MGNPKVTAENRKKPRGKPFPPGNCANPGGRPKLPTDVVHVRELARQYTTDAISTLARVMKYGSPNAQVSAANALIDRGWGKSEQPVAHTGTLEVTHYGWME